MVNKQLQRVNFTTYKRVGGREVVFMHERLFRVVCSAVCITIISFAEFHIPTALIMNPFGDLRALRIHASLSTSKLLAFP